MFVFAVGVLMMTPTSCRIVFHLLPIGGDRYLAERPAGGGGGGGAARAARRQREAPRLGARPSLGPSLGRAVSRGVAWERADVAVGPRTAALGCLFTEPQTSVPSQPAANY